MAGASETGTLEKGRGQNPGENRLPLAKPDPDVLLDLQPMIDAIYQRSRYERSIDYRQPLTPPLDARETAWLEQQLQARQKRKDEG